MSDDKLNEGGPEECQRCGTCCRKGGPALHKEDGSIIKNRKLSTTQLITIRPGEPSYDPSQNEVVPAMSEFVKIGGRGADWTCDFLEESSNNCLIYQQRPLECRLLFCGNTGPIEKVIGRDLLSRKDLLERDDPVLPLIDRLEEECPYLQVHQILESEDHAGQLEKLTVLVRRDLAIRQAFLNHFPDREKEELFLFGRPLFLVLAPHGFRLIENMGNLDLEIVK
jgi:Fe-S-cluster containining protein